ncbi:MAG: GNAT family N-acetyltransferase [bacterium]|nr:GNAT family N-acetyltransferase [bacterium]
MDEEDNGHHDMLVKLYNIENDWSFIKEQKDKGIVIRKPIGPEKYKLTAWIKKHFGEYWAAEADCAVSNTPVSCFIAVNDKRGIVGFACTDATALGFFGPTGVVEECRGKGTGKALLLAALLDMKLKGYGYAIIGGVGPVKFYSRLVGAEIIHGSEDSIYKTMI